MCHGLAGSEYRPVGDQDDVVGEEEAGGLNWWGSKFPSVVLIQREPSHLREEQSGRNSQ